VTREIFRDMARRMMLAAAVACLLGSLIVAYDLWELTTKGPLHDPWQTDSTQVELAWVDPPVAP
jgi:hypothetical protein